MTPRQLLCAALVPAISAFSAACSDEKAPVVEPPPPPPFVLEKEHRVLPVDFGELQTVEASPVLKADDVSDAFPATLLQLQPWDELHERELPGQGEAIYEHGARLATLLEEAGGYGDKQRMFSFDLLSRKRDALWCLPEVFEERLCTFDEVRYVNAVTQMVADADQAHSPELLIAGSGMNKFAVSDPDLWAGFVTWYTGTVAANVDSPLATAIDWEAFVEESDARKAQIIAAGEDPDEAPALAYKAVWDEQFVATGIMEHMHIVTLRSRPTALRVDDLPDDYYSRLIPLIPANKPVAFLPLTWTNTSADASTEGVKFLKRFRWLVAGLNVTHVSWGRLVDIDSGRCPILQNLGVPGDRCLDGLLPAVGPPKSLWEEFLDESAPTTPPGE